MSLLMKALEKAAKDRVETGGEPTAPNPEQAGAKTAIDKLELELEPVAGQPAAQAPAAGAPLLRGRSTAPLAAAQAAAMLQAERHSPAGGIVNYLRDRPLVAFGALAALFMVGFGGYVYVQLNPGMFAKQSVRPAQIAQSPAPVPAPAATASSVAPNAAPPVPLASLTPPPEQSAGAEQSVTVAPPAPKIKSAPPAAKSAVTARAATARDVASATATAPAPATSTAPSQRDTIRVTAGSASPTVNPLLTEAYSALVAGNFDSSRQLYNQLLASDAGNIEALLGLAAIATQRDDREGATQYYVKVLERDPRNTLAQAGLINIVGRADPLSAETRIKQLIARDPTAAYLHFTLGNAYIDQKRWPDAQQAFFQAYHLQPDNPDYAYNLAVALEHIGQSRLALDFYRRAVSLAATKGRANFSPAAVQERVAKLDKFLQ